MPVQAADQRRLALPGGFQAGHGYLGADPGVGVPQEGQVGQRRDDEVVPV
jgi:hypothetical protein